MVDIVAVVSDGGGDSRDDDDGDDGYDDRECGCDGVQLWLMSLGLVNSY